MHPGSRAQSRCGGAGLADIVSRVYAPTKDGSARLQPLHVPSTLVNFMHIFIIVAALLVAIAPAHDVDSRELCTHAKGDPTIFETPGAARGMCCTLSSLLQIPNFVPSINYVPADSSLYFLGAVC
jgi:hypothetical protein